MWLGPRQASNEQHAIAAEVTKTNRTQETRLARRALVGLEHAHGLEERRVLRVAVAADGVDARVDAPDAALRQHLLVGLVVVVAVEDDLWESTSESRAPRHPKPHSPCSPDASDHGRLTEKFIE